LGTVAICCDLLRTEKLSVAAKGCALQPGCRPVHAAKLSPNTIRWHHKKTGGAKLNCRKKRKRPLLVLRHSTFFGLLNPHEWPSALRLAPALRRRCCTSNVGTKQAFKFQVLTPPIAGWQDRRVAAFAASSADIDDRRLNRHPHPHPHPIEAGVGVGHRSSQVACVPICVECWRWATRGWQCSAQTSRKKFSTAVDAEPQKTKGLVGANRLTPVICGSSTWARTRDLRINSLANGRFLGLPGILWYRRKFM
jgi:hypothetical protein